MNGIDRLPAKIWQESNWSRALAILLGVVPVYVMPLYFTISDLIRDLFPADSPDRAVLAESRGGGRDDAG
jgi:hypothetical protein